MAAITFNTAYQKQNARERLKIVLIAFHDKVDAFVSDRIRRAAAEAEHVRPRQILGTTSPTAGAK